MFLEGGEVSKLDQALSFHENSLRLRSQRQQLLASNIANSDTPNYKAKDLNFAQAMQDATSQRQSQNALTQTNSQHLPSQQTLNSSYTYERNSLQNNLDGNTVDMDVERNQFTENALRYEASVSLAHDEIKNILSVLQG